MRIFSPLSRLIVLMIPSRHFQQFVSFTKLRQAQQIIRRIYNVQAVALPPGYSLQFEQQRQAGAVRMSDSAQINVPEGLIACEPAFKVPVQSRCRSEIDFAIQAHRLIISRTDAALTHRDLHYLQ
jgi:hypothetical protein